MTEDKDKMALLVLSCDGYSDLWDDFFNLRDRFWPDCPYKWYVVTESKDYQRDGVEVIKCGKDLNWAGRFRKAVKYVNTPYIGLFLDDYFITEKIDTHLINSLVARMETERISLINTSDVFYTIINNRKLEYYDDHLIRIPDNLLYGISTASALWESSYLLSKIGEGDYSAWQFEIDRYKEAKTTGFGGLLLCDDRMPFHVSKIPVVTQAKYTPAAIKYFKKRGISINGNGRKVMSDWDYFIFNTKLKLSKVKYGKNFFRWVGKTFFNQKYFMD